MKVYQYNSFSKVPDKGNPAGVVIEADNLSEEEMQSIAHKIGFNETAFIMNSNVADIRIRYFTPGHEMNLCGHGTVASIYALFELTNNTDIKTIETKAGILSVKIIEDDQKNIKILMEQSEPKFIEFKGNRKDLAESLNIDILDIDERYPIVYGSTGTWTLLVPIKRLETFEKMEPKSKLFPEILKEIPKSSVHPFCFDAYDKECLIHARHFSSPFSGTIEDAVTGTASGVLGAYYLDYVKKTKQESLAVEQGNEIKREGKVFVDVIKKDNTTKVEISGYCSYSGLHEV